MNRFTKISSLIITMMLFLAASLTAQELSKSYSENYDVNADAKVSITNKFGHVHVESWDRAQVAVDVVASVAAKSEEQAQKLLDKIDVEIKGSADLVEAETKFSGKMDCNKCDITININVKMPASNALELYHEFGNATIGDLSGPTEIQVEYGNLEIGGLTSRSNEITVKFGSLIADYFKAADLKIEYGELELEKAEYLDLYTRFSGLEIGEVSELILDSEYDGLELSSVDKLEGRMAFSGLEIGEISESLEIESEYGGIEIDRVTEGFSLVKISSSFGDVELDISSSASYSLHAKSSFGDIDFPEDNASITTMKQKDFENEVEAFVGDDKGSASRVVVYVKNADVEIN